MHSVCHPPCSTLYSSCAEPLTLRITTVKLYLHTLLQGQKLKGKRKREENLDALRLVIQRSSSLVWESCVLNLPIVFIFHADSTFNHVRPLTHLNSSSKVTGHGDHLPLFSHSTLAQGLLFQNEMHKQETLKAAVKPLQNIAFH